MMRHVVAAAVCVGLIAGGNWGAGRAQAPQSAEQEALVAASQEFNRHYQARQWPEALKAADRLLALAEKAGNRRAVAGTLYNKACVYALQGDAASSVKEARAAVDAGYTDYLQFSGDADFDAVRNDPAFAALMREVRERFGPRPIEWDPSRTSDAFPLTLDDPALPQLVEMRREFGIDAAVAGAADDYAKLKALTGWTTSQWQHSPTNTASKTDPITILREARAGGRFICRDYAVVLAGAARAYGLPSRVLNLMPADVETRSEAHSVAEVWVRNKWVLADGQYGTIAERGGVPLNGVELQAALAEKAGEVGCAVGQQACAEWKRFILRNMYFFKIQQDQRRFLVPASPRQLVLVPRGAKDPTLFAGGNAEVFAGSTYISDPRVFYAPPRGVR